MVLLTFEEMDVNDELIKMIIMVTLSLRLERNFYFNLPFHRSYRNKH